MSMHEKTISLLSKMLESRSIPHTLLFTGPKGIGKKKVAISFAKWLFHLDDEARPQSRLKSSFNQFCKGRCSCESCHQVDSLSHPDFYFLGDSLTTIEQARALRDRFSLAPLYALRKIAIISNAENMTHEAASAFLKTIEEPRGNALFMLLAKSRLSVLPTISSRAFEVRFVPTSDRYSKPANRKDASGETDSFEAAALYDKFLAIQKYTLHSKGDLLDFLDSWLIELHKALITQGGDSRKYSLARRILYAKQLISTTNTNPQFIMEELCATHYL